MIHIILQKSGFIQIPILIAIVVGVFMVGGAGYVGVQQYQKYQTERIEKERQIEEEKKRQESDIAELKETIEALKNNKPDVVTQTIIKESPILKTENDLPSIIQHWRPIIVYIECEFLSQNTSAGSGLAVYVQSSDQYTIWTNKHVVGGVRLIEPQSCRVFFPDNTSSHLVSIGIRTTKASSDKDFGIVDISKPNVYLARSMRNISNTDFLCTQKPSIGDRVVILGYPSIGSRTDITATEGIISGYDGDYFITSAKVDHGNSGGAAILIKDNCYLGIPTFARVGSVESLARIFDFHKILE